MRLYSFTVCLYLNIFNKFILRLVCTYRIRGVLLQLRGRCGLISFLDDVVKKLITQYFRKNVITLVVGREYGLPYEN